MPAPDFRLYHGNDLTLLAGVLAAELARPAPGGALLQPDVILIPQPAMKRWLQNALAAEHGIAANLQFLTPGEFVRLALDANLAPADDAPLAEARLLRWRLWRELADPALAREPRFQPLRALLQRGEAEQPSRSAWSLAGELAAAFEKYQAWRRDWLARWDRGAEPQDWQAELWRRATRGQLHRGARLDAYLARHGGDEGAAPRGLPPRLFAFACQSVSPDVLRVIASAAHAGPLHFFFVSPVASWWGDLRSARERLRDAAETTFADDEETPLLRANGAAGRDFVRLLFSYEVVHPSLDLPLYVPPDPAQRRGLLHRLQRDLLARRAPHEAATAEPLLDFDPDAPGDRSLQVHACATRLRELQVLHDQLRALLDADPSLQPRDIAVLAPDIDAYAAQVHAVFGASSGSREFIPYAVADASTATSAPLAAAFLRLLALPQSRFEANEILELLALPAVAQRHGLDAADLARVRRWIEAAGARWGLDAAHRVALGAPEESAYSWAWAIDRLLLGHALGNEADVAGVAPLPLLEGSALLAFDGLLQLLRSLARLRRELSQPRPALQWQAVLVRALDDLFAPQPDAAEDRRALDQLRTWIAEFATEAAAAGVDAPVPPPVLRDWFAAALAEPDARQPFLTGGVSFARMVPLRLLPFRVICVLGMSDGAYPRRDPVGGINRIDALLPGARRRLGDRSLRDDDRALFLQLFAAATDVFYLSYLGLDVRTGERLPPSVVVSELLDTAAAAYTAPAEVRARLTIVHPLQPFAPEAFGRGDARRLSYRAAWRVERAHAPETPAPFAAALPPPAGAAAPLLDLEELRQDLAHPLRSFLRHRLGLRLDRGAGRLPDAEPFTPDDPLHAHALKQRLFAQLIASEPSPDVDALAQRLLAEGRIAPGAAGRREVARLRAALLRARAQWRAWSSDPPQRLALTLALPNATLQGTLAPVHALGLLQFRAGKPHGRTRLELALDRLFWSASGEPRPVHRLVLEDGACVLPPLPPARARAALAALVELVQRSRAEALPLMPRSAWAYVEALQRGRSDDEAFAAARGCWSDAAWSEGQDRWVRQALRGADPFAPGNDAQAAAFRALARQLFATLHEGTEPLDVAA